MSLPVLRGHLGLLAGHECGDTMLAELQAQREGLGDSLRLLENILGRALALIDPVALVLQSLLKQLLVDERGRPLLFRVLHHVGCWAGKQNHIIWDLIEFGRHVPGCGE